MASSAGRFLRDNAFLVAAVALPIVVVGFFLLSTAIPRWTVAPPRYDVLVRTSSYDQSSPRIAVEFTVRDQKLLATVRPVLGDTYPQRPMLWLFDHGTMKVRQVPIEYPEQLAAGEPPRTFVIDALAGRRVLADTRAPDGYEFQSRTHTRPGIVGDLFGMGRYNQGAILANRGRVVPIEIPSPYEYQSPVFVGWLIDEGTR